MALLSIVKNNWIPLTWFLLLVIILSSLWPPGGLFRPDVPGTDKIHHFVAYAVLVLPMALRKPGYRLLLILFFIGCSGAIELVQPYINRRGDWLDLFANITGIICGLIVAELINFVANKKQVHTNP